MASQEQLQLKKQIVEDIKSKITNAKSLVIVEYVGLTVAQDTALRAEMRKNGIEYQVLKNRLLQKAFEQLGHSEFDASLNGPSAVAFCDTDVVAPAKVIADAVKKYPKLSVKCGMVEGQFIDANGVKTLSQMPSKEVIIATVLGTMQAPISGLVRTLNATIGGLAICLDKICQQKAQ